MLLSRYSLGYSVIKEGDIHVLLQVAFIVLLGERIRDL